jgi:hypothetical protein
MKRAQWGAYIARAKVSRIWRLQMGLYGEIPWLLSPLALAVALYKYAHII